MNAIASSAFEILRLVAGGDTKYTINDVFHIGPTYHGSDRDKREGASSIVAAAGMVAVAGTAAAAMMLPSVQSRARALMDSVVEMERVSRTSSSVAVYLRPLDVTIVMRRQSKSGCTLHAAFGRVKANDLPTEAETEVLKFRVPAVYEAPRRKPKASFVRYRSKHDVDCLDRADCVFIEGLGWLVVVQRHDRVNAGLARMVDPSIVRAVDMPDVPPRFAHLARIDGRLGCVRFADPVTGETAPPRE